MTATQQGKVAIDRKSMMSFPIFAWSPGKKYTARRFARSVTLMMVAWRSLGRLYSRSKLRTGVRPSLVKSLEDGILPRATNKSSASWANGNSPKL